MIQRDKNTNVINREPEIKGYTKEIDTENQVLTDEVREKFMDGPDEQGENVHVMHPNRNTNKPDIDKPPYS